MTSASASSSSASASSSSQCDFPLSPRKCHAYEKLVASMVEESSMKYASFVETSFLDPSKWKLYTARDATKIYKSVERVLPTGLGDLTTRRGPTTDVYKPQSKMLSVGTIQGSLSDAMLGVISPTAFDMYAQTLCIDNVLSGHQVLQTIEEPTLDDPFRAAGIRWAIRTSRLPSLIKLRDLVWLEASGMHTITVNGRSEQVGYVIYESVNIPEADGLRAKGTKRAQVSIRAMYREVTPGHVQLFATHLAHPGGNPPRRFVNRQAVEALMVATRVTQYALMKKLVWLMKNKPTDSRATVGTLAEWSCRHRTSALSSLGACEICSVAVCSSCIRKPKLVLGETIVKSEYRHVAVCKGCLHRAVHDVDAHVLAVIKPSCMGSSRERRTSTLSETDLRTWRTTLEPGFTVDLAKLEANETENETEIEWIDDAANGESEFEDDEAVDEEIHTKSAMSNRAGNDKGELWVQMNALRLKAEQIYHMTKNQGRTPQ